MNTVNNQTLLEPPAIETVLSMDAEEQVMISYIAQTVLKFQFSVGSNMKSIP